MVPAVIQPQTHSLLVCTDVWLAGNDKVYLYVTGPVRFPQKKRNRGEIKPGAEWKTYC